MADLPSSFSTVNDVEGAQDSLVAESQYIKLGSNDNYLKDGLDAEITARAAADTVLTTNKNALKTELNQLILFQKLVRSGTINYESHFTSIYTTGQIGTNRRTAVVWPEKRTGTNQTWIKVQVFYDPTDDMAIDYYQQITSLFVTQWDTFYWYHDFDSRTIKYRFYKNNTMSVP